MNIKPFLTLVLAALFFISGYAQDRPEALKDLYNKIQFDQVFPSSKVDGLDKLTQEEKEKLKTAVLDFLVVAQADGYKKGMVDGYKQGSDAVLKMVDTQIKEFLAKQEAESQVSRGESKARKAWNLFLLGLAATAQTFQPQNYQAPAYIPPPQPTVSLSSTTNKRSVTKIIDRGQYILLDDNSLWEVNSLDRLTSSLWMSIDQIIIVSSGFETKLLNTRDNKSVTAKRVK